MGCRPSPLHSSSFPASQSSYSDIDIGDDFDFDASLDRCNALVSAMLKEAKQVLNEPPLPALLTQGVEQAEEKAAADAVLAGDTAGAVFVSKTDADITAVELLKLQQVLLDVSPLNLFASWLKSVSRGITKWLQPRSKVKQM